MANRKTEALIVFRSKRKAKPLRHSKVFRDKDFTVWTLGDKAECGGLSVSEKLIRSNDQLASIWKPYKKVFNNVKQKNSWELWWAPNLSLLDFITKKNEVKWLQTKTRQTTGSGKIAVILALLYLKQPLRKIKKVESLLKMDKNSTMNWTCCDP